MEFSDQFINLPRRHMYIAMTNKVMMDALAMSYAIKCKHRSSVLFLGDGDGVRKVCRFFHVGAITARRLLIILHYHPFFEADRKNSKHILATPLYDHYKVNSDGSLKSNGCGEQVCKCRKLKGDFSLNDVKRMFRKMVLADHISFSDRKCRNGKDNLGKPNKKYTAAPRTTLNALGEMIGMSRQTACNYLKSMSNIISKTSHPIEYYDSVLHCELIGEDIVSPKFIYGRNVYQRKPNEYHITDNSIHSRFVHILPDHFLRIKDNDRKTLETRLLLKKYNKNGDVSHKPSKFSKEYDEKFNMQGGQWE